MCRVVNLQYACGHINSRQWLIPQYVTGQCPAIIYGVEPYTPREQRPSCTDILRARGILPDTDAGRQMLLGYRANDPEHRDPRLNYGNHIISDDPDTGSEWWSGTSTDVDIVDETLPRGMQFPRGIRLTPATFDTSGLFVDQGKQSTEPR